MEALRSRIATCTNCDLGKTRKNAIFGEGNPDAEIVIVGEAPGADEDLEGRPFIGKSGKLLDKILEACGFTRVDHVFITNIVRCRPPRNRVPSEVEIRTCIPYLLEQIEQIDPRIIVTLGATPLKKLLKDDSCKITKMRGKWLPWNDRLLMPVYHPAALLRNPGLKKDTWTDFQEIMRTYRKLVDPDQSGLPFFPR